MDLQFAVKLGGAKRSTCATINAIEGLASSK